MASSPTLLTPTSKPSPSLLIRSKPPPTAASTATTATAPSIRLTGHSRRRDFVALITGILAPTALLLPTSPASAASDDEYVRETAEMINRVRSTIKMDKNDPNIADAVSDLRENSNSWVAKYRREKALLGRASFRDMYSALNAVSGHYVSFGPTSPIPAKRKARILEEMETAEKALQRGR